MANLITYVNTILKPYYKYITGIFLVILFVLVAKFAYETFFIKKNKNKQFTDVANANNLKPIIAVYFFNVDWCPHCVKAQPEWKKFSEQYHNKIVNGYVVKCYDINCNDDNGDEVIQFDNSITNENSDIVRYTNIKPTPIKTSDIIKKYNIDSYPTIKLTKDDVVVEFEAKITKDTLIQFVQSV